MPRCTSACFALITTTLEVGSFGNSIASLNAGSAAWSLASLCNMVVSNIVSAWIALWYLFAVDEGSWFGRGAISGLGLTMMALRQYFEYKRFARR